MQPGLRRIDAGSAQLTPLEPGSTLWNEKKSVLDAGASRHCQPGFDPACAIKSIAEESALARCAASFPSEAGLELAFEEDFAVLDGSDATVPWMCVCVPSHWVPEDKVGKPLAEIHAPVADNAALVAATRQLVQLVTGGERWERFVWTITPSPRYDQHPRRHSRTPWPQATDNEAFARQCFLRAERQTFFPIGRGTRQAIFTIRVMVEPLAQALDSADKAARLHDAIASMSDAVLAYKNLTSAREPLLGWLQEKLH